MQKSFQKYTTILGLVTLLSESIAQNPRFVLPTPNDWIYKPGGLEHFLVGTDGRPYTTGGFGCVRTDGLQFHEGIDIKYTSLNSKGEPTDPVVAVAPGVVAYVNSKPGLSTYGKYILIQHKIDGVELYSLYAHLAKVESNLRPGSPVSAGQVIGFMGRTASTYRIPKDRAHLHFEFTLLANDYFPIWFKHNCPGERNDHGVWNGQNLLGINPIPIFLNDLYNTHAFNLADFLKNQPQLCRVQIRCKTFPWLKRYPFFIKQPNLPEELIAGYELGLTFNGIPVEIVPKTEHELVSHSKVYLVSVNETEFQKNPCAKLVRRHGGKWQLTQAGYKHVGLLTYTP